MSESQRGEHVDARVPRARDLDLVDDDHDHVDLDHAWDEVRQMRRIPPMWRITLALLLLLMGTPVSALQSTVTWTDNSPGASNPTAETGFRVERRDGPDTAAWVAVGSVAANVTTFGQTGLATGTRYCYRVIALSGTGESAPSPVSCGTPDTPLPASGVTVIFAP
jgi:hypothetical protein